ncbi:Berberine bridge enzyme-like 25, partial [Pseudolycoriella hygida]
PNFNSLEKCLTSAGIDQEHIIRRSNETKYKEINWQWNTVNGHLEPMAYLVAKDVSYVRKAVICCQQLKIRLVPRSGGHSLVKSSFGDSDSLVIDLKRLNSISVDPDQMSCEIGTGAQAGFISYKLWKKGQFMIPTGICPTVGIGGLASGGGYGYYTRFLGLTSDNLLELEMVDAQGKLRHPSDLANITRHCNVGMTKVKSIYVDVILDEVGISKLQTLLDAYLNFGIVHIEQNSGAVNNLTCSQTAFIHRGTNMYHIQLEVFSDAKEDVNLKAISAMNAFYESSRNVFHHRESYQNYLDEDISDYLERYYGANLRKLIEVKKRIDPGNMFHHPHSIPVDFV